MVMINFNKKTSTKMFAATKNVLPGAQLPLLLSLNIHHLVIQASMYTILRYVNKIRKF